MPFRDRRPHGRGHRAYRDVYTARLEKACRVTSVLISGSMTNRNWFILKYVFPASSPRSFRIAIHGNAVRVSQVGCASSG
jgi:hypothetical protein